MEPASSNASQRMHLQVFLQRRASARQALRKQQRVVVDEA